MQREHDLFLKDILIAIKKIENYTGKLTYEEFLKDELRQAILPKIPSCEKLETIA